VAPNSENPELEMMTALGPCGALSSSPMVINEVTTVASVWALAAFGANDPLSGNTSYLNIGASSGNASGLANAFAAVDNLVDITTGQALYATPAGNAAVPYPEINALADILNACTDSSGGVEGDGSVCGNLFSSSDPLRGGPIPNPTSPADTLQAAFNIAQHPAGGFGYVIDLSSLFGLFTAAAPFQPVLQTSPLPADVSISLNYTGGGGLAGSSAVSYFALDASGNVWFTDTANNRAIEWNNFGAVLSPASGFTADLQSPGPIAIDLNGNAWICQAGGITELTSLGTLAPVITAAHTTNPFTGGGYTHGCQGMAIDGAGNVWVSNSNSVSEFTNEGVPESEAPGYQVLDPAGEPLPLQEPIVIEPNSTNSQTYVWLGVVDTTSTSTEAVEAIAELSATSGLPVALNPISTTSSPATNFVDVPSSVTGRTQFAVDHKGNVWIPLGGSGLTSPAYAPPYGPGIPVAENIQAGYDAGTGQPLPFTQANGVAVDGASMVWVPDVGNNGALPGITMIDPADGTQFATFQAPSLAAGAQSVGVDQSGNLWVLLNNETVTEYIGLATPAVAPLSVAVSKSKLGSEP
jgi:hypothetical protein